MQLQSPAPGIAKRSGFGPRRDPITGALGTMHRGIDYGGTFDVLAAGDGVVVHVSAEWNSLSAAAKRRQSGGNVVIIQHASNLYTAYYHGKTRTHLNVGDRVKAGDKIYTSGSTGKSTGPHLHFETRTSKSSGWKDPEIYLTAASVTPLTPTGVTVNGRLDSTTWKAWQIVLKEKYGYVGRIDGRPGVMTWMSVQRSAKEHYNGRIDGAPGPLTYKAVQSKLKALGFYTGRVDGVFGKGSISALQACLNAGKY